MQVVTHTSKIKMMPYNSMQMINLTLSFDVLLPRGTLMSKTLHRSQIRCMLLSVIEAYDQHSSPDGEGEGSNPAGRQAFFLLHILSNHQSVQSALGIRSLKEGA